MGRKYKNPPLVEAVCEFRLTPDTQWDLTIPGLFYEDVKDEFPHREQRSVQEFQITHEQKGFRQELRLSERVMLFSPNRNLLIQIGPRLLVINALKPYPTWEGFKPRIELAWNSLQKVVNIKGLERIGLRYINRIELPDKEEDIELNNYLKFHLTITPRLSKRMTSFIAVAELTYVDDRDRCRMQLMPGSDGDTKSIILDIDYFLAKPRAVGVEEALQWVEEAHTQVEETFESCITDRLRERFGEVS